MYIYTYIYIYTHIHIYTYAAACSATPRAFDRAPAAPHLAPRGALAFNMI